VLARQVFYHLSPAPSLTDSFIETQPCSFVCIVTIAAFELQWQSCVLAMKAKPKIFSI
jgi:hypothetical protein